MPLRITKISKRYGNNWVLRDIEFQAGEGRILGIIGNTAAGKTTLLKLIAGKTRSNSGSITLDNADVTRISVNERGKWLFSDDNERAGFLSIVGLGTGKPPDREKQLET